MKFVVLGGTGGMGSIAVTDLFDFCKDCEIVIAARDGKKADEFAKSFKSSRVKSVSVDVSDINKTAELIKGSDCVINCVVYYFNLDIMKACLKAGVPYLDLGGLFHITGKQLKMHQQFKKKGIIGIVGIGATPGITNVLAGYGAKFLDKINEIHISFGDKDYTKYNQPFVLPYTMYTLFDEYMLKPALFTKGKLKFTNPMSGEKILNFPKPVGKVKGFYTIHSELRTFPSSFRKKGLKECTFRVTFEEEFTKQMKFLIDTGFGSDKKILINGHKIKPRDFTAKVMDQWLPKKETKVNDLEFLKVEFKGMKKGKNKHISLYSLAKRNKKYNYPAGSYNTGVPPSIAAQMIAKGQVKETGVLPPELCIDPLIFFKELKKRNIKIFKNNTLIN